MNREGGFTDLPVSKKTNDSFMVTKYIEGLTEFIKVCDTPMTIAIQGDWGSGKTSMMNMIKEELEEDKNNKIPNIYFNTWQYSQFNMGDELSISFLSHLIDMMDLSKDEAGIAAKKTINLLGLALKKGGLMAIDALIGGKVADTVEELADKFSDKGIDLPKSICKLKEEFQKCVIKETDNKKSDRIVIFVDDLDRLNPGKAVELLEVLKLFLDCERCVFVLAIDYEVVSKGVKEKYGDLLGDEKGKSFFDKIIQVPFKMPVALYEVGNFVKDVLTGLEIYKDANSIPKAELDLYVDLIRTSISCNPRAMKRLFNAYLLLMKIYKGEMGDSPREKRILFAILCLQQSYEEIYDYILKNSEDISEGDLLIDLKNSAAYQTSENEGVNIPQIMIPRAIQFMDAFVRAIDDSGDGILSSDECKAFSELLKKSKITSATSVENVRSDDAWKFRGENRGIAKGVNEALKKLYPERIFDTYQVKTDRKDWKFQYGCGYTNYSKGFDVGFKIETELMRKPYSTSVVIYASARKEMDINIFKVEVVDRIQSLDGFETNQELNWISKRIAYQGPTDGSKKYHSDIKEIILSEIKPVLDVI